jgi:hypothetical protein
MIRELLDESFVLRQREFLANRLSTEAARLESGQPASVDHADEHEVTADDLRAAAALLAEPAIDTGKDALVYIPSDPVTCLLQACLEESYMAAGVVERATVSALAAGAVEPITDLHLPAALTSPADVSALVAFEEGDPRYATQFLLAKAAARFSKRPTFVDRPARVTMADRARVVLFGDWGTGIARARAVAASIKDVLAKASDREGHVIHLGDVYFAGFEKEYRERILPHWPGAAGRSWSIGGNHDMYAGGGGFIDGLLGDARFSAQQKRTWFVLENSYWQICALDSAFNPPDNSGQRGALAGTQAEQVHQLRSGSPKKQGILLSHHQPFNAKAGAVEIHSPSMVNALQQTLDAGLVRAWFWGHEHDAAVFKPWRNVAYPCLTGHAGVPESFKARTLDSLQRWRWTETFDSTDGKYFTMGFTVLDFDEASLEVSFYNEHGKPQAFSDGRHVLKPS